MQKKRKTRRTYQDFCLGLVVRDNEMYLQRKLRFYGTIKFKNENRKAKARLVVAPSRSDPALIPIVGSSEALEGG